MKFVKTLRICTIHHFIQNVLRKKSVEEGYLISQKNQKCRIIGSNYANNPKIPNLLFISLDPGDERENYHSIEDIRKDVKNYPPRENVKDKIKHWYQTFDIATLFLDKYLDESIKKGVSYADTFFAHTNSAKCTQNKIHREQADANVFNNCREFVVKEIPLFNADIIITQGVQAEHCLNAYKKVEKFILETIHNGKEIKLPIYLREINNKKILHIPMSHPSYFKKYWGQKKAFKENLERIIKILEQAKESNISNSL